MNRGGEWHSLSIEEVTKTLRTSLESGLSTDEAKDRLRQFGSNELRAAKRFSAVKSFLAQFKSLVTVLLLAAVAVALYLGETLDAIAIALVILLSAVLGFATEYRAEKSIEALKNLAAPVSTVIRDGAPQQIQASALVPGDVVLLEAVSRVPADCRIVRSADVYVDESPLTGESVEVEKDSSDGLSIETPIHDRTNVAYIWALARYGRSLESSTIAFLVLAMVQLTHALNCRSEDRSVFELGLVSNRHGVTASVMVLLSLLLAVYARPLQLVLRTTALTTVDWVAIALVSVTPVLVVEAFKYVKAHAAARAWQDGARLAR